MMELEEKPPDRSAGIGTLNEGSLHAAIKQWVSQSGDRFEVPVDGYIIDIVRQEQLIEIQTANFAAIKTKLKQLTRRHDLHLVYPIAVDKWIVKKTPEGMPPAKRRKSPKRGRIEDLFREMVSFPQLINNPRFSVEVLLIQEEEHQTYSGTRRWRRKGWSLEERHLLAVIDRVQFRSREDWKDLLPSDLSEFTTLDLVHMLRLKMPQAQRMAYCLRAAGVIDEIGKKGRSKLYRIRD